METVGQVKRLDYIDFVKGIAIIAVTIGHVVGSYNLGNSWLSFYVYSFELSAFFIVSGYTSQSKLREYSFKEYLIKQAKSILYPYFMFSLAYLLLQMVIALRKGIGEVIHTFWFDIAYTMTLQGLGALWFMPTFFFATILAFIVYKYFGKNKLSFNSIISILLLTVIGMVMSYLSEKFYVWNDKSAIDYTLQKRMIWTALTFSSRIIVCSSLILIGRVIYKSKDTCSRFLRGGWSTCLLLCSLLFVGYITGVINYDVVDLHFSIIRNPLLFYVSAICTTCGLMILGTRVKSHLINYLGKSSLIIMFCQIVQQYTCLVVNKILLNGNESSIFMEWILSIITVLFVLAVGYFVSIAINNNRILHLLISPRDRVKI